jgi:hypothetical protein
VAIIGGVVLLTVCLYAFPRAVAGAGGTKLIGAGRVIGTDVQPRPDPA